MKIVIDVHYQNNDFAVASGILFRDWTASTPEKEISVHVNNIQPYKTGFFFERELPCITALLEQVNEELSLIIIDGYVTLGKDATDGLGAYLYQKMGQAIPIIGVAKNQFYGTPQTCKLFRGESKKPLFITSLGIDIENAKSLIASMHGEFRVPTLLKAVDTICRNNIIEICK